MTLVGPAAGAGSAVRRGAAVRTVKISDFFIGIPGMSYSRSKVEPVPRKDIRAVAMMQAKEDCSWPMRVQPNERAPAGAVSGPGPWREELRVRMCAERGPSPCSLHSHVQWWLILDMRFFGIAATGLLAAAAVAAQPLYKSELIFPPEKIHTDSR